MEAPQRRQLLAYLLPFLLAASSLFSFKLSSKLLEQGLSSMSLESWIQLLALSGLGLLAAGVALWWVLALAWIFFSNLRQPVSELALPLWAPKLLRYLLTGSLAAGLALSTSAAQATPLSLENQTDQGVISPFFSLTAEAVRGQENIPATGLVKSPGLETLETVSNNHPLPLSPFFPGQTSLLEETKAEEKTSEGLIYKEATPEQETGKRYRVEAGDSLWSIAEQELDPQASGQQVLAYVQALQQANADQLPSLDSLIFPGQLLILPTP